MTGWAGHTDICILRVESEPDRLLITMTVERCPHRGLAVADEPRVQHFARAADAIKAVAEFLGTHEPAPTSE